MKILVTGGSGYIGSALVDKLISENYEVNVLDDLSNGFLENINTKANFINGSVLDEPALDKALEGVEAVFHLAAKIRVEEGEAKPDLYKSVNVDGTLKLISKCKKIGIKKFVFASTAAVYGDPTDFPVTEESQVRLEEYVFKKFFHIKDSKSDKRLEFLRGDEDLNTLQQWKKRGEIDGAFILFPNTIKEIKDVADAGETMPPKSTWIEPKIPAGMLINIFE